MSPYVHEDYREWLRAFFAQKKARSGHKSQFSDAIGIQTSYLSQVLANNAHLTTEQALLSCRYLGFDEDESEYFVCLVQKDRTTDNDLRNFLLQRLRKMRSRIKQQDSPQYLDLQEEVFFRNSLPMRMVLSFLQKNAPCSLNSITERLDLSAQELHAAVRDLLRLKLIVNSGDTIRLGARIAGSAQHSASAEFLSACRMKALSRLGQPEGRRMAIHCSDFISGQNTPDQDIQKIIQENLSALIAEGVDLLLINIDLIPVAKTATHS